MTKIIQSVKINQPIDVVYQAYIDADNMLKWMTDLEKFEYNKDDFGKVGATARLHYNQKGRTYIMEDKLEFLEPGKEIISTVSGNGLKAKVVTIFNSLDNNEVELILFWDGKGQNILLKLLLPFLKRKIKSQMYNELNKFKNLVEKFGVKFKN